MTDIRPARALAVYGTLAPGESNHEVVADIDGHWVEVSIRGHRYHARWRDMPGYPGFTPDPDGPVVPALVLVSDFFDRYWDRLDHFEGPGYQRVEIDVFARELASPPDSPAEPADPATPIGRAWVYETLTDFCEVLE